MKQVQESTATLYAARSFAKANHTDLAWDVLRSLFVVQGISGFLPKYTYFPPPPPPSSSTVHVPVPVPIDVVGDAGDAGDVDEQQYFIPNSTLPSHSMFGPLPPPYLPCNKNENEKENENDNDNHSVVANADTDSDANDYEYDYEYGIPNININSNQYYSTCYDSHGKYTFQNELNIQSSGRSLSSLPLLHSTIILDIYYLSNQTTTTSTTTSTKSKTMDAMDTIPTTDATTTNDFFTATNATTRNAKHTGNSDLQELSFYFQRLYKLHHFWMEHLRQNCVVNDVLDNKHSNSSINMNDINSKSESGNGKGKGKGNNSGTGSGYTIDLTKCYNVIHPWESLYFTDLYTPSSIQLWRNMLEDVIQNMNRHGWTVKPEMVPNEIRNSIYYPPPLVNDTSTHDRDGDRDRDRGNRNSNEIETGRDVYDAMMYLFECQKNITSIQNNSNNNNTVWTTRKYESEVISQCGFALLDAAHVAILSKSNQDLIGIGEILKSKHSKSKPTMDQLIKMNEWLEIGHSILDKLWNETEGRYLSRVLQFRTENVTVQSSRSDGENKTSTSGGGGGGMKLENEPWKKTHFVYDSTKTIFDSSLANLLVGWDTSLDPSRFMRSVSTPLIERDGSDAFNCGSYSIWSHGGCASGSGSSSSSSSSSSSPPIDNSLPISTGTPEYLIFPLLSYWVSIGLSRNHELGLKTFIQKSTIQLMCLTSSLLSLPLETMDQQWCGTTTEVAPRIPFGYAYDAINGTPMAEVLSHDDNLSPSQVYDCDVTATTSAAIMYNILVQDRPFHIRPSPPIKNAWIVVLIITELVIAFSIGLSCVFLSLNLLRRLKNDDDISGGDGGNTEDSAMMEFLQIQNATSFSNDDIRAHRGRGRGERRGSDQDLNRSRGGSRLIYDDHAEEEVDQDEEGGEHRPLSNSNPGNDGNLRLDEQEPFHIVALKFLHRVNPLKSKPPV